MGMYYPNYLVVPSRAEVYPLTVPRPAVRRAAPRRWRTQRSPNELAKQGKQAHVAGPAGPLKNVTIFDGCVSRANTCR